MELIVAMYETFESWVVADPEKSIVFLTTVGIIVGFAASQVFNFKGRDFRL